MRGKGAESWLFGGQEQVSETRRKNLVTEKSVIEHGMQKNMSESVVLHGEALHAWREALWFLIHCTQHLAAGCR